MKNNSNYSFKTSSLALVFLLSSALLSGCGQRGALYLPEDKAAESNEAQFVQPQRVDFNLNTKTE